MKQLLRRLLDNDRTKTAGNTVQFIGLDHDPIGETEPVGPVRQRPAVARRSCVVTSVRNEGLWMLEWLAHYRTLGVDSIVVYCNDNSDDSDYLLDALASAGVIHLRRNEAAPSISAQMKAFRHAFWLDDLVATHEWVAMLDADEFFIPAFGGHQPPSLSSFLDNVETAYQADAIAINWKWFGGNKTYARRPGLQMQTYRSSASNDHIKTFFKLRMASGIPNLHHPKMIDGAIIIGGGGQQLSCLSPVQEPTYDLGQINHYWQRSFQEYFLKKQRGRGGTGLAGAQRSYSDFFGWWQEGTQDDLPSREHVRRVKKEMRFLLSLPGVRRARWRVEAHFRSVMAHTDVRAIYDSLS